MFDEIETPEAPEATETPETPEVPDASQPPAPPAESEEVIDGSEISDADYDATMEKMSPRQLAAMNLRMRGKTGKQTKELEELRVKLTAFEKPNTQEPESAQTVGQESQFDLSKFDRIAMVSGNEYGRKAVDTIKSFVGSKSNSDELISAFIDIANIVSTGNSRHFANAVMEPFVSERQATAFSKAIGTFSGDDKYKFAMSKPEIREEVEAYVRTNFPKDMANQNNIRMSYLEVKELHPEIFASQGKREIVEDGDIHGRRISEGSAPSANGDWKKWAQSQGMSITSQDDVNTAKRAYSNYKDSVKLES